LACLILIQFASVSFLVGEGEGEGGWERRGGAGPAAPGGPGYARVKAVAEPETVLEVAATVSRDRGCERLDRCKVDSRLSL
jgi:hypothetical protein